MDPRKILNKSPDRVLSCSVGAIMDPLPNLEISSVSKSRLYFENDLNVDNKPH